MNAATLSICVDDYPHTMALHRGETASETLKLAMQVVKPISKAFAPMVREGRFDISEMAIATFLMAKAAGRDLVLLPLVVAERFQETAMFCRAGRGIESPADLAGKRVGVRAYSQTTGMWIRGVLQESFGLRADAMRWVTFEDAHEPSFRDPPWVQRASANETLNGMFESGALDAAIMGFELPAGDDVRTVFPDPAAAGAAFQARYGFKPVNHLVVMKGAYARDAALVAEVLRQFNAAGTAPRSRAALNPALELASRWCADQGLMA
ncbi:MAG: ABC transporter substrate-binding protein, partial [Rhodobacter sp.]|nr:ABC transporter substrate-binding protein [Rhodobacter sp.]